MMFERVKLKNLGGLLALGVSGLALTAVVASSSSAQKAPAAKTASAEPAIPGGPARIRRLSDVQYKRAIEDIFGTGITVPGRFDPRLRDGLLAVGDGQVAVSSSGIEQYELRSRQVAAQVMSEGRRKNVLTCAPAAGAPFDTACATAFFTKYGRLLYRRPLSQAELTEVVGIASSAAGTTNFYRGMEAGLSRLLGSVNFIFRVERSEPDPANHAVLRLDNYSLATRISFLLWNAPPDAELLDAAASGALRQPGGLEKQVDRLIASPRFALGARAFFADMFGYEQFDGLSKDEAIFPKFTPQLAKDAQEQALRTIVDLLVTNNGDYRDIFTTRKTFVNRNIGSIYHIPITEAMLADWQPYTFSKDQPYQGVLMLPAFLMLDPSHEGRSSPTIRGKSIRELFLCQPVPMPPPNVNFTLLNKTDDKEHPTARLRLATHAENPVCAACHRTTDPIGLAMENFDAIGNFRTRENGVVIDASGTFDDKAYKNASEMVNILHDSPEVSACVVQRAFEYGTGRKVADGDSAWLTYAGQHFADDKYKFAALLREVATSKAFQTVSKEMPVKAAPAKKMAALDSRPKAD